MGMKKHTYYIYTLHYHHQQEQATTIATDTLYDFKLKLVIPIF